MRCDRRGFAVARVRHVPSFTRRRCAAAGRVSKVRHAVARAREAEQLAAELEAGPERKMLEEIATLWREIAQHQMLEELRRPSKP